MQYPTSLSLAKMIPSELMKQVVDGELMLMIVTEEIKIVDVRIFKTEADREASQEGNASSRRRVGGGLRFAADAHLSGEVTFDHIQHAGSVGTAAVLGVQVVILARNMNGQLPTGIFERAIAVGISGFSRRYSSFRRGWAAEAEV